MSDFSRAGALVAESPRVLVFSGAGISTSSGIPDFRGPNGVWTKNPQAEAASHFDNYVASPEVRQGSWARLLAHADSPPEPNAAHYALAQFQSTKRLSAIITQNTDGLHLAAGTDPKNLIEIHGHVRTARCLRCAVVYNTADVLARVRAGDLDPHCLGDAADPCGGILATSIVRFGEELRPFDVARSMALARSASLLICVGSTLSVYPAASLVPTARGHGAQLLIINAQPTEYDARATYVLRGDITEVLPAVLGTLPQA
jgi:NAD-dependent deacetylase